MKSNAQAYLRARDLTRLSAALDELAAHSPDGYSEWESIAKTGAIAARAGDLEQVRNACSGCHDQHRARYRIEMRDAALFSR
jgi:hypothetical protein